jgi:hypothetical protein
VKAREKKLLENEAYLAAVWVDARFRILLSDREKETAKKELKTMYLRLRRVQSSSASPTNSPEHGAAQQAEPQEGQSSDFDAYLDSLDVMGAVAQPSAPPSEFEVGLQKVEQLGRLKLPNVWDIISRYPEVVQPVARMVSCLPSTQVSVERMFSHLKLVLRDNRARMGADLADAIIFLRTNKCV